MARASALAARLGGDVAEILASTIAELCRGQVLELQHLFDVDRSEEGYSSAIEGKTASLFGTSCRVGGMVSGVGEPTLDALTRYGFHLGMCFQIVDDVLDLTASEAALGKPAGQDLLEGVYTLPVIYALRESPELRELLGQPIDQEHLGEVRRIATSNGAVDAAAPHRRLRIVAVQSLSSPIRCANRPSGPPSASRLCSTAARLAACACCDGTQFDSA